LEKIKNPYLRLFRKLLPWTIFFVLLLFTLKIVHAQGYLGEEWNDYIKDIPGYIANDKTGEELAINFIINIIRIVRNIVGALALIMGVLYGFRLVISRGQEEVISKQKTNFLYAFIGFVILIISENIATIFNPEQSTTGQIIDFNAARDQLRDIVDYIKWLLGSVIVLFMTISSIKLITGGGDDENITQQKRNITGSGIGILAILLASNIVNAIYVIKSPNEAVAAAPGTAIGEITSVIRLILIFLGPMAIAFTIYAGFLYLTALDNEEQVDKGKRMIVAGIVAIFIIYGAFAIVNTLTSADLALLNPFLA